jgi:hypothetical protein
MIGAAPTGAAIAASTALTKMSMRNFVDGMTVLRAISPNTTRSSELPLDRNFNMILPL